MDLSPTNSVRLTLLTLVAMRRVLHLKLVTQCAMLEEFGIFLVLAAGSLFAYRSEALLPSSRQSVMTLHTPQRINRFSDVLLFRVGIAYGRTLIGYRRPGNAKNSIFCFLEPDAVAIQDTNATASAGERSKWFKVYKVKRIPLS